MELFRNIASGIGGYRRLGLAKHRFRGRSTIITPIARKTFSSPGANSSVRGDCPYQSYEEGLSGRAGKGLSETSYPK